METTAEPLVVAPAPSADAQDAEHLRLLAIFHYVMAGVTALVGSFPLLHVGLGIAMILGVLPGMETDPGAHLGGWIFFLVGATITTCAWIFAAAVAWAGRNLAQRRRWTACFVVAVILCALAPLGTVLGVFSILVLQRPSVKALFAA